RDAQVAQVGRDPHVADHAPADQGELAAEAGGGVHDLLDPVDVAGEAGDHDAPPGRLEDVLQGPADLDLGDDEAGLIGVGGVRQEQVDPLGGQPGQAAQVGRAVVDRGQVHLPVAGGHDRAPRG